MAASFRLSTRTAARRSTAGLLTRRASAALGALVLAVARRAGTNRVGLGGHVRRVGCGAARPGGARRISLSSACCPRRTRRGRRRRAAGNRRGRGVLADHRRRARRGDAALPARCVGGDRRARAGCVRRRDAREGGGPTARASVASTCVGPIGCWTGSRRGTARGSRRAPTRRRKSKSSRRAIRRTGQSRPACSGTTCSSRRARRILVALGPYVARAMPARAKDLPDGRRAHRRRQGGGARSISWPACPAPRSAGRSRRPAGARGQDSQRGSLRCSLSPALRGRRRGGAGGAADLRARRSA